MVDTIAAISTALGEGGIGIIRLSGPKSLSIVQSLFVPAALKNRESRELQDKMLTYGNIVDPSSHQVVDEVMVVYMAAPHTYTREDVVEIDCHGSVVSLRRILSLCYDMGAREAEPGEFTKRAFLNGRLDLSQAESVIDLIEAKTDSTFDVAMDQLRGRLSEKIFDLRKDIMELLVSMTVNIDYPDEDIEEIVYGDMANTLSSVVKRIDGLLASGNAGKTLREGLRVSIIGRPNVGKSSLMNGLLRESRAIVTNIPGTTRDTIEETVNIGGIPVILTDTAGIRQTENQIERIGIERSKESFNKADLVILMVDVSEKLTQEDKNLMELASGRPMMLLANKIDAGKVVTDEEIRSIIEVKDILHTSMREEASIEQVEAYIKELVYQGEAVQRDSVILTNVRHRKLLEDAKKAISDGLSMTRQGEALEIIEIDVHTAYDKLGEIVGESVTDDIIEEVFSRFCLGK